MRNLISIVSDMYKRRIKSISFSLFSVGGSGATINETDVKLKFKQPSVNVSGLAIPAALKDLMLFRKYKSQSSINNYGIL